MLRIGARTWARVLKLLFSSGLIRDSAKGIDIWHLEEHGASHYALRSAKRSASRQEYRENNLNTLGEVEKRQVCRSNVIRVQKQQTSPPVIYLPFL